MLRARQPRQSISTPCEALITASHHRLAGHQIPQALHPGRIRSRQPRERPKTLLRELPAHPRTTSPLPPQPAIPTTQCSASAPPPAPRLRSPFSATPLPAASTPASARRALRALPTTPSTARGPLSSSTLPTPLVSEIGSGEKALAVGEEEEGLRERMEVWVEEIGTWSSKSKSRGFTARMGFQTIE